MAFSNAISTFRTSIKNNVWLIGFCIIFTAIWVSTLIGTSDLANWFMENALVFIFLGYLMFTFKRHQFSDVSYLLITIYLSLHVYGSKYSYANNPFGFWLQDALGSERNNYDRIVHFSFGFLLAYPLRELFLNYLKFPSWVAWVLPIEITLSISAFYELIEWWVADIFFPAQGEAYLGSQGDIWDAQKDIFLAVSGAILATTIVSIIKKTFNIYHPK